MCKSAFLWFKKKNENEKTTLLPTVKNCLGFEHFFRNGAFFT
jgi:hypothetical protein